MPTLYIHNGVTWGVIETKPYNLKQNNAQRMMTGIISPRIIDLADMVIVEDENDDVVYIKGDESMFDDPKYMGYRKAYPAVADHGPTGDKSVVMRYSSANHEFVIGDKLIVELASSPIETGIVSFNKMVVNGVVFYVVGFRWDNDERAHLHPYITYDSEYPARIVYDILRDPLGAVTQAKMSRSWD